MKSRVTIVLDPAVLEWARKEARLRVMNLSTLIEDLLEQAGQSNSTPRQSFTQKWAGKLTVRKDDKNELLSSLKTRYRLER